MAVPSVRSPQVLYTSALMDVNVPPGGVALPHSSPPQHATGAVGEEPTGVAPRPR